MQRTWKAPMPVGNLWSRLLKQLAEERWIHYVKNLTFHQTALENNYIALERHWQGKQ